MKFKLYCRLKSDKRNVIAEGTDFIILNVLPSDGVVIDDSIMIEHEFVVVVNKRGQLTVLCTK